MQTAQEMAEYLKELPNRKEIRNRMPRKPADPKAAEIAALRRELEKLRAQVEGAYLPREFYTVPQAAQFLSVKPATVYQYLMRGTLRKQSTGGPRVYISHAELVRYMTGNEPDQNNQAK